MKKVFFLLFLISFVAQPIEAKVKRGKTTRGGTTAVINNQIQAIYRGAWGNLSVVEQRYLTHDFLRKVQQRNSRYENEYSEWDNPYGPDFVETFCINLGDAPVIPKLSPKVDNVVMTDDAHAIAHVRVIYVGMGMTDDVSLKFVLFEGQWKVSDIIRGGRSLLASLSNGEQYSFTEQESESDSWQWGEVTDPTDDYVNVRSGPGTKYEVLTTLDVGAMVLCETSGSNWLRVYYDDGSFMGWVFHDRIRNNNKPRQPQQSQQRNLDYERLRDSGNRVF